MGRLSRGIPGSSKVVGDLLTPADLNAHSTVRSSEAGAAQAGPSTKVPTSSPCPPKTDSEAPKASAEIAKLTSRRRRVEQVRWRKGKRCSSARRRMTAADKIEMRKNGFMPARIITAVGRLPHPCTAGKDLSGSEPALARHEHSGQAEAALSLETG